MKVRGPFQAPLVTQSRTLEPLPLWLPSDSEVWAAGVREGAQRQHRLSWEPCATAAVPRSLILPRVPLLALCPQGKIGVVGAVSI